MCPKMHSSGSQPSVMSQGAQITPSPGVLPSETASWRPHLCLPNMCKVQQSISFSRKLKSGKTAVSWRPRRSCSTGYSWGWIIMIWKWVEYRHLLVQIQNSNESTTRHSTVLVPLSQTLDSEHSLHPNLCQLHYRQRMLQALALKSNKQKGFTGKYLLFPPTATPSPKI